MEFWKVWCRVITSANSFEETRQKVRENQELQRAEDNFCQILIDAMEEGVRWTYITSLCDEESVPQKQRNVYHQWLDVVWRKYCNSRRERGLAAPSKDDDLQPGDGKTNTDHATKTATTTNTSTKGVTFFMGDDDELMADGQASN